MGQSKSIDLSHLIEQDIITYQGLPGPRISDYLTREASQAHYSGGTTFAKGLRNFRKRMPKKQRRLARDSAILAKLLGNNVVVVDGLNFEKPRTKDFLGILNNLKIQRSCLVTIGDYDENLYKSATNVPKVAVMPVAQLNAGDICRYSKMLFTKEAFLSVLNRDQAAEN